MIKHSHCIADKTDRENLNRALTLVKNILTDINYQVGRYEKEQRLLQIYHRLDVKSTAWFKGRKFKVRKVSKTWCSRQSWGCQAFVINLSAEQVTLTL
jgi:hypothetical protein